MQINQSLTSTARSHFHDELMSSGVLAIDSKGKTSNADIGNKLSMVVAKNVADQLKAKVMTKIAGQTSGSEFESIVANYVNENLRHLKHIRPGSIKAARVGFHSAKGISEFEQYKHLQVIKEIASKDPNLATSIGRGYTITPDVVVYRDAMSDEEINQGTRIVDDKTALKTDLRANNGNESSLLASISVKWTIRSDRAQNSRSEALNLIRNRKGGTPRIMVVTAEPLPSRLSSLALGTGDIDCVYHFALYELQKAILSSKNQEAAELLNIMIEGKRLKDISDLSLDLVV